MSPSTSRTVSANNNINNNFNSSPRYSSSAYVTTPFSRVSSNAVTSTSAPNVNTRFIGSRTSSTTQEPPRDHTNYESRYYKNFSFEQ